MTSKNIFKSFGILLLQKRHGKTKDTLANINVSSVCNLQGTWITKLTLVNGKLET